MVAAGSWTGSVDEAVQAGVEVIPQGSALPGSRSIVEPTDFEVRKTAPSPRGDPESGGPRPQPGVANGPGDGGSSAGGGGAGAAGGAACSGVGWGGPQT